MEEQPKVGEWIPADNPPEDDKFILLSFENFSLPLVGRYEEDGEGGAYYVGDCDEEDSCLANDLFVNAWMPLPEPYNPNMEEKKHTNADHIRSMSDEELAMCTMCPNENGLGEIDCNKSDSCNCYECILKWLQSEVDDQSSSLHKSR